MVRSFICLQSKAYNWLAETEKFKAVSTEGIINNLQQCLDFRIGKCAKLSIRKKGASMVNLLCKLGVHAPDKYKYLQAHKIKGRHKWHRNYVVCRRCGKRVITFSVMKQRGGEGK